MIPTQTHPFFSISLAHVNFRYSVQQFKKLRSCDFGFGIVRSEGGSFSQGCAADDHRCNNSEGISDGLKTLLQCI